MKKIASLTALALTIASPALAQTAPAAREPGSTGTVVQGQPNTTGNDRNVVVAPEQPARALQPRIRRREAMLANPSARYHRVARAEAGRAEPTRDFEFSPAGRRPRGASRFQRAKARDFC